MYSQILQIIKKLNPLLEVKTVITAVKTLVLDFLDVYITQYIMFYKTAFI